MKKSSGALKFKSFNSVDKAAHKTEKMLITRNTQRKKIGGSVNILINFRPVCERLIV